MYPVHKFENFKTVRSKSLILSLILSTSLYSKTTLAKNNSQRCVFPFFFFFFLSNGFYPNLFVKMKFPENNVCF